jgi:hypothetical protein
LTRSDRTGKVLPASNRTMPIIAAKARTGNSNFMRLLSSDNFSHHIL